MKTAFLILTLLLSSVQMQGQKGTAQLIDEKPNQEEFRQQFSRATLAVYRGKQVCSWGKKTEFIFEIDDWQCEFKSQFTCTATVINSDELGYVALTAGHCFDWAEIDNYYVSDTIASKPVLHHVDVMKFQNDGRYDYALLSFKSMQYYPVIDVEEPLGKEPAIGTEITNINFSYGLTREYAEGKVVSNLIETDMNGDCDKCRGRYLVSIGLGPGASGSAIVDKNSQKIIGLVEGMFPDTQMPTVIIPMGANFTNFFDDDSSGLKPLPEVPKPVEKKEVKPEPVKESFWLKVWKIVLKFFFPTGD